MSKKPPDKQSSKRNRKQGQGVPDNSQTLGFLQNNPLGEDSSSKVTNKIKLSGISIENIAVKKIDEYLDEKLFAYIDGELSQEESDQIKQLIGENNTFQDKFQRLKAMSGMLKDSLTMQSAPLSDRLSQRLALIKKKVEAEDGLKGYQVGKSGVDKPLRSEVQTTSGSSSWFLVLKSWVNAINSAQLSIIGGSFASGLACALLVTPIFFNFQEGQNNASVLNQVSIDPTLVLNRGTTSNAQGFLNMSIHQDGVSVVSGGILRANVKFSIKITSPISGQYELTEQSGQEIQEITSGDIERGADLIIPHVEVFDQDRALFNFRVFNKSTEVSHTMEFKVEELSAR